LQASSGLAGLEAIRSDPAIGLVITDHAMPDMNGIQFARLVRDLRPALPIILATGYSNLLPTDDFELPRLSKPYGADELVRLMGSLLMGDSTASTAQTAIAHP
jgi:CheY-like chemotaxis protein